MATLFVVLVNWRVFQLVLTHALAPNQGGMAAFWMTLQIATLVFAIGSIVGLWRGRTWGFISFYAFAVLFLFLFGMSLIPFVPSLLPGGAKFAGVIMLNGLAIFAVAFVQWKSRGRA